MHFIVIMLGLGSFTFHECAYCGVLNNETMIFTITPQCKTPSGSLDLH